MRGLSLTQPWATLVAIGAKRIETRSWSTKYRGPIAIAASQGFPRGCQNLCEDEPFFSALERTPAFKLPRGVIVATATLVECRPTAEAASCDWSLSSNERSFGDYSDERFAWFLSDIVALKEPIACKGALGLWTVPADIVAAIARQREAA